MAEWKTIERIIGAAVMLTPGTGSSERFVIVNRMRSPTRARTTGPGTWSPLPAANAPVCRSAETAAGGEPNAMSRVS